MEGELFIRIDKLIQALTPTIFYLDWSFWGFIVLVITLIVLIIYTNETHKLSVQARDANLRPVILRSGYLINWDIKYIFEDNILKEGTPIQFQILKNIATSISGYIVINNKKYLLNFGNKISEIKKDSIICIKNWGWMKPETDIFAIYFGEGEPVKDKNKICIQYRDIEGSRYYTLEDENFIQKSYKGEPS